MWPVPFPFGLPTQVCRPAYLKWSAELSLYSRGGFINKSQFLMLSLNLRLILGTLFHIMFILFKSIVPAGQFQMAGSVDLTQLSRLPLPPAVFISTRNTTHKGPFLNGKFAKIWNLLQNVILPYGGLQNFFQRQCTVILEITRSKA